MAVTTDNAGHVAYLVADVKVVMLVLISGLMRMLMWMLMPMGLTSVCVAGGGNACDAGGGCGSVCRLLSE